MRPSEAMAQAFHSQYNILVPGFVHMEDEYGTWQPEPWEAIKDTPDGRLLVGVFEDLIDLGIVAPGLQLDGHKSSSPTQVHIITPEGPKRMEPKRYEHE